MQATLSKGILLVVLSACLSSAMALDPEACQERLKSVDDRIASGKYSAQNVQTAQQMRDSIMQSCAYLDEATVGQMMEGFEQLLPTRSEAERQAHEEAKRTERAEQLEVRRAELEVSRKERAERERKEAALKPKPLPISEVLKRPPTAKSVFGEFVDRDDGMYYAKIHDWDLYRDKVRVLYATDPANYQFVRGESKQHIYVIESDAKGNIAQKQVTATTTFGLLAAGLRRGHDEVILQWNSAGDDAPPRIEAWSISDQKLLSTASTPALPWGKFDQFRLSTSDGNVLFVFGIGSSGKESSVSWMKVSLEGKVLARGTLESDISMLSVSNWFHTPSGGGGFVIYELANTEKGINSELAPIARRVGTNTITAVVSGETRLLVASNGSTPAWKSPAIARSFMWLGLPALGPITTLEEQAEMDRILRSIDPEHGGSISLVNNAVVPIDDGYGVLVENNYRNKEQSPVHGKWLYEYAINGEVRKTYLNPAAEHLGVDFSMIAAPDEGAVFLYAGAQAGTQPYVVLLDENRQVAAYGKALIGQETAAGGIIADEDGVWVLGTGKTDDGLPKIWLERIDF